MRGRPSLMRLPLVAALLFGSASALAQPPPAKTMSDSDAFLRDYAETRRFMSGRPVNPRITPDEKTVLFLRGQPRAPVQTLFAFDVASGETKEVLTPEAILQGAEETLSAEEKARRERQRVSARGFTSYQLSEDGQRILVPLSGKLYLVERATGKSTELKTGEGVIDPRFSPDGKHVAYVREHDVFRIDLAANKEQRVTTGGTAAKTHGLAEFVAQEEMSRFSGCWWSPDAKSIAYTESDTSGVEKLVPHRRDAPGARRRGHTPTRARARPTRRCAWASPPSAGGKTVWVQWDAEKYPYLATVVWPKGGPLTRARAEPLPDGAAAARGGRGQRQDARAAHREGRRLARARADFPQWLEDGSGFLWYTERNGGPEVELRQADGRLARSLVKPDAGFRGLARYVEKDRTLYFTGGPNPTESYLWRVKDGGAPEKVRPGTQGEAVEAGSVSQARRPARRQPLEPHLHAAHLVARADGTRVGELPSVAVEPSFTPVRGVPRGGPERKFQSSLVRPRRLEPGQKLPVIVEVYGGPTVTVVHKTMARAPAVAVDGGPGLPHRPLRWPRHPAARLRSGSAPCTWTSPA